MPDTRERWRHRLPHWEVAGRPHFITIRCAGSLPAEALVRVKDIHAGLQRTAPMSPQFAMLQRQYFLTCEKFIDRGESFAPFRIPPACAAALAALDELETLFGWRLTHAVIMPNHAHFLLTPAGEKPQPLRRTLRAFKGRAARAVNLALGRRGAFWQPDWFDRWMRDPAEEARVVEYIRQNPVKAGLVSDWRDWPWTRSTNHSASLPAP